LQIKDLADPEALVDPADADVDPADLEDADPEAPVDVDPADPADAVADLVVRADVDAVARIRAPTCTRT